MNTSALRAFAPAVRKQLIEAVSRKLDFALSARTPDFLSTYAAQVRALRELSAADRKELVERVAYTWFNRFTALRYLDARNWHPFHARVLMPRGTEETLPEVFVLARTGAIPDELRRYVNGDRMDSILQARIPSTDIQGEVYRLLVLGACRFYHGILPELFERLDDETELLLPDDLLSQQSVAQGFRTEITDEDCEQVEVLGWLYQFYISEKKDEVMNRKKAVPAEDIPAATQLFTPHWIVRYLVENSLGKLWLLNRPASLLKAWMPYYIDSVEAETEFPGIDRPQDIRLCDPAVGSGHMLTYAFDLLYLIYEEEGYAQSEIPALILRHNLTGIEIDCRAAQLASLALTLKAREKSQGFFQPQHFVPPTIIELRDVHFGEDELRSYSDALNLGALFTPSILKLMDQFRESKNFGSLIQPCASEAEILFARGSVVARGLGSNLFLNETHKKVLRVLEQAEMLTQRYHVVVANPPYMGSRGMNAVLKSFVEEKYTVGKADLYGAFLIKVASLGVTKARLGMITIPNWMFLGSFEPLRSYALTLLHITTLVHNGRGLWGSDFGSCAFTMTNSPSMTYKGKYKRLFREPGEVNSSGELERRFFDHTVFPYYKACSDDFAMVPGVPLAYWTSDNLRSTFIKGFPLKQTGDTRQGMATSDNERFLRYWHEVSIGSVGFGASTRSEASQMGAKWFPYNKGGEYRKWYGNQTFLVNWEFDGQEIIALASKLYGSPTRTVKSMSEYFKECVSWSKISISDVAVRYFPKGFLFDVAGCCIFFSDRSRLEITLGFLNTKLAKEFLKVFSPTLNFEAGHLAVLPLVPMDKLSEQKVAEFVNEAIDLARRDWDSSETSWGFSQVWILNESIKAKNIKESWEKWAIHTDKATCHMQDLETKNNRLFIDVYGLQDEITPEVSKEQITLASADPRRDMAAFISYAVGCMMGRYSLDRPGLILADADDGLEDYVAKVGRALDQLTFAPARDGIVPVLDDEWFTEDIVTRMREFLKATFGEAALRENIRFIEESLGRELRSYFLNDFYKDHLQTYKKRPIYWMVQSPRKGFSVLIYLHRYTRDTMNVILNRYLREFQVKVRSKIDQLQRVGTSPSASAREKTFASKELTKRIKTLHECEEWERQIILPLAQARIGLDLDDGVKVNYLKLGEALAAIPGLAAHEG